MRLRRHSRAAVVAAFAVSTGACVEPGPHRVWEGERLTLSARSGDITLCGGTLGSLERFVNHVHAYWTGEPPPGDFRLQFELRSPDPDRDGAARPYDGTGWVDRQTALKHELSHLVVGWGDGLSAPSLSEGIAEALGSADPGSLWGEHLSPPTDFAFLAEDDFLYPEGELSARYYGPSAQLVGFLARRYGVPSVREAYRTARYDNTEQEIEDAYLSAFGDGLYDAFDDFEAGPQCALQAWECSDAVLSHRQLPATIAQVDDCTQDADVLGATSPTSELWFPVHEFLLDLPADTDVVIDATDNAYVQRMFCLEACNANTPPNALEGVGGTLETRTWQQGRISVRITPLDPTLPFSATITPE